MAHEHSCVVKYTHSLPAVIWRMLWSLRKLGALSCGQPTLLVCAILRPGRFGFHLRWWELQVGKGTYLNALKKVDTENAWPRSTLKPVPVLCITDLPGSTTRWQHNPPKSWLRSAHHPSMRSTTGLTCHPVFTFETLDKLPTRLALNPLF